MEGAAERTAEGGVWREHVMQGNGVRLEGNGERMKGATRWRERERERTEWSSARELAREREWWGGGRGSEGARGRGGEGARERGSEGARQRGNGEE